MGTLDLRLLLIDMSCGTQKVGDGLGSGIGDGVGSGIGDG